MSKLRLRPVIYLTIINIIGFILLYLYRSPLDVNMLYAGLLLCGINIAIYFMMYFTSMGDAYLYLMSSMLVSIGLIMLFRIDPDYGNKQIIWFFIGIIIFLASYLVMRFFKYFHKLTFFFIALTFCMFVATLVFGEEVNGSKNWIRISGFGFQPSELIKIIFSFTLACFFSDNQPKLKIFENKFIGISYKDWALFGYVYMCLGFLVLQREWGTAVLFFLVYITTLVLYDAQIKLLLLNVGLAVMGGIGGYFLTSHIKSRVDVWRDPWADVSGKGYQITQSLFAIFSGGYFGTGLGNGNPHFIPEVHSDFIFSAICEEMGVFTGIAIIIMYFIFSYRGIKISLGAKDEFYKSLSLILVICFAYQTFIIVGGVIKLIPLTGITLPFVSYGGSSLVSSFILLGIMTAISYLEAKK